MLKMYAELAKWWRLVSPPEDYREEAEYFLNLFADVIARPPAALLELGSGGGSNAVHMKTSFASMTLVDLSPDMLEVSREINPECEHIVGDMRSVRLGRVFDAVFVHDAVGYMLTLDELKAAAETAFVHCKPGGIALFVPDHVRETFEPDTDHGGTDGDGRGVRFLEWTIDPDPNDSTFVTDYVFALREGDQTVWVEHDRHTQGLFSQVDWLRVLREVGFDASFVIDSFERHVFIALRP